MAVSTLISMQIFPENGDGEAYLGNKKMKWSANSHRSAIEGISRWHPIPSVLLQELLSESITERWMERVAQTEGLERVMQQWCQREIPAIQDLKNLAPCVFANE